MGRKGFEARFNAPAITYADDLVTSCKGSAAHALEAMRSLMTQVQLNVNEEKTRVCRVPADAVFGDHGCFRSANRVIITTRQRVA